MTDAPSQKLQARRTTLALMTATGGMVAIEGSVLSILVEPIKLELALTDTQVGLVIGLALSLVSSIASLPFSRWADVGVRRTVLSVALLVCSIGTVAIGFAQSFLQLLLARIAQGVGTGGSSTPGQSLLADLYAPHERAAALAILGVGVMLASTGGTTIAAYAADAYGWRSVYWALGAPGLVLAVVIRLTMEEPARPTRPDGSHHALPLGVALRDLASRGTFRHVTLAMMLLTFGWMAAFGWSAPFLMRTFDKTLSEVAPIVGAGMGGMMIIGQILGGFLANHLAQRDIRWHLWLPLVATATSAPLLVAYLLTPTFWLAVLFGGGALLAVGLLLAPLQAAMLGSVHPQARAISLAIMGLFSSGIGATGGMFVVGALSDWLEPTYGVESLRWAMVALAPAYAWGALHLWIAARHYGVEAEVVTATDEPS